MLSAGKQIKIGGAHEKGTSDLLTILNTPGYMEDYVNRDERYFVFDLMVDMNLQDKRVLDFGCGAGWVTIVAAKLGASEAVGYEPYEYPRSFAKKNVILNEVAGMTTVVDDIIAFPKRFDVILNNIGNLPEVMNTIQPMEYALADNGLIVLQVHDDYEQQNPGCGIDGLEIELKRLGLEVYSMSDFGKIHFWYIRRKYAS